MFSGLCEKSLFDTDYAWTKERNTDLGRFIFRGFSTSYIHFDDKINAWKLSLYTNNKTFGITKANLRQYPFGLHNWKLKNDNCRGPKNKTIYVKLHFNACSNDQFNCDRGWW